MEQSGFWNFFFATGLPLSLIHISLTRLHCGAGEDDAVDLLGPEGGHRRRHRQIGLAGAGGADAQGDHVLLDGLHILLLSQGLGLDGPPLGGDAQHLSLIHICSPGS